MEIRIKARSQNTLKKIQELSPKDGAMNWWILTIYGGKKKGRQNDKKFRHFPQISILAYFSVFFCFNRYIIMLNTRV